MRAVVCTRYGEPEALELLDIPEPEPGPGQLLIQVWASGVNFPDALNIQGLYQDKQAVPFVPGCEAAGVVESVGVGVTGFSPGDRVAAITGVGAFAEKVVAPATAAIRLPDAISYDFAATFGVTFGTAYLALCHQAKVQTGESVLVLGASGGVGLAAVEIARAKGARVIAAASSPEKLEIARQHGAHDVIDYSGGDLKDAIREIVGKRGVDVVLDPVGDRFAEPAMRCLAWEGRYLVIGFAGGDIPKIPLNLLLLKNASAIGTFMGAWAARNPELTAHQMTEIFAMRQHGELSDQISERFSLAQTPVALRRMMDRQVTGKLLIEIASLQPNSPAPD